MITGLIVLMMAVAPIGTFGNTYDIAEKDALVEMEEKVAQLDKEKIIRDLKEKARNYKPKDLVALEPSTKDYSYHVDMTYTLDRDIPRVDENGNVVGALYPKGYTYNPLEYLPADPPPIVVFNGNIKKEVNWVNDHYGKEANVMLIMTDGDWNDVAKKFGRHIYYLRDSMVKKLQLKNTVSVVYKEGKYIRVDVKYVDKTYN